jgi:hypothetical protein
VASFENTVMIRRSIEDVFGFLSDFENVPTWNYAISETHKVSQDPVGVGAIYQQVCSVPSRSEERFEVSAYNPPRHLEIQGQLGPFPSRLSYALDAVPEGNPRHQLGRAGTPWPGPPTWASRRAPYPGRRGRKPPQAQGTAGTIGHTEQSVHTCSPVLLLIVARVLWTARPPVRPGLGAEATMAEPAGPMIFRCPLAVRCTCPPARCTAATISLASLDRQRFGAACFFTAMPTDPQHPKDTSTAPIVDSPLPHDKPTRHRAATRHASGQTRGLSRAPEVLPAPTASLLVTAPELWTEPLSCCLGFPHEGG